jgi:cbb3-type cytochrome oxidase maturation protein
VSFLIVTIPVSFLLAGTLLWLVIRAARSGVFDDMEGPSARMLFDDDTTPEREPDAPPRSPGEGHPDPDPLASPVHGATRTTGGDP